MVDINIDTSYISSFILIVEVWNKWRKINKETYVDDIIRDYRIPRDQVTTSWLVGSNLYFL